jgi:hypothetical protein
VVVVVLEVEVVVDDVLVEDEEAVVPVTAVVVVVFEVGVEVVRVVPPPALFSSLSRSNRGMVTAAAITIAAATPMPIHIPSRLFFGGKPGGPYPP